MPGGGGLPIGTEPCPGELRDVGTAEGSLLNGGMVDSEGVDGVVVSISDVVAGVTLGRNACFCWGDAGTAVEGIFLGDGRV